MRELSFEETSAILAGLRLLQRSCIGGVGYGALPAGIYDILTDGGEDQPPTPQAEGNTLAERINLGTLFLEDDGDYGDVSEGDRKANDDHPAGGVLSGRG